MRSILHINDIAPIPQTLAKIQREMGFKSDVVVFEPDPFVKYGFDFHINIKRVPSFLSPPVKLLKFLINFLLDYDIFHFHFNSIFGLQFPYEQSLRGDWP